jgi:hypothetical protein
LAQDSAKRACPGAGAGDRRLRGPRRGRVAAVGRIVGAWR